MPKRKKKGKRDNERGDEGDEEEQIAKLLKEIKNETQTTEGGRKADSFESELLFPLPQSLPQVEVEDESISVVPALPFELWDLILNEYRRGRSFNEWIRMCRVCRAWHALLLRRLTWTTNSRFIKIDLKVYIEKYKEAQEEVRQQLRLSEVQRVRMLTATSDTTGNNNVEPEECKYFVSSEVNVLLLR